MYASKVFARRRRAPLPASAAALTSALEPRADEAASLLKRLAHPARLKLLCHLLEGERSVTELGALAGVAQPTLSQQLGILRGEGLVATRRDGKQIHYRIDSPAALALLQALHGVFCAPAP